MQTGLVLIFLKQWKKILMIKAVLFWPDVLKLVPLFDVNPNPLGKELSLNTTENNNQKRLSLALDSAKYYNLSLEKAKNNAMRIATVVKNNWRNLAKVNGCSNAEIERMKKAFEDESILIKPGKKLEKDIKIEDYLSSY